MAPPRTVRISETTINGTHPHPLGPLGRVTLYTINRFTQLWNNRTGAIFIVSSLGFFCFFPLWLVVAILAPKDQLCTLPSQPTVLKVLYFILPCWWLQMMWMSILYFGTTRRNRAWAARGGESRDVTSLAAICFMGIAISGLELLVIGLHWSGDMCTDED